MAVVKSGDVPGLVVSGYRSGSWRQVFEERGGKIGYVVGVVFEDLVGKT